MGNSGSTHNINWDSTAGGAFAPGRSKSELNGYYQRGRLQHAKLQDIETQTQTLLRRPHNQSSQRVDRTSMPPLTATSEQFKVLPKLGGERLKLRPTSNGLLLHAGGTISGRNKDEIRAPGQMQRSRTLIFEQREEKIRNNDERNAMPAFQRSQTLLHMPYRERDHLEEEPTSRKFMQHVNGGKGEVNHQNNNINSQAMRHARSEPNFRNDLNKPTNLRQSSNTMMDSANVPASTTLAKTNKLNKYNKKRKAPAAPANTPLKSENGGEKSQVTRRYRTNIQIKPQQSQPQPHTQPLKQAQPPNVSNITAAATPIYRREKSCDAILLRSKTEHIESTAAKRLSYNGNESRGFAPPPPPHTKPSPPSLSKQASKIPQLKRTFYFGMQASSTPASTPTANKDCRLNGEESKHKPIQELRNKVKPTEIIKKPTLDNPKDTKDNTVLATPAIVIATDSNMEQFNTLNYRLHIDNELMNGNMANATGGEEDSEMNDNGLLIHIRPSLPRRQLDIPSFSPAAAWRMLTNEEERHRLLQRTTSNTLNCESPIQLRSSKLPKEVDNELRQELASKVHRPLRREQVNTMAWTPQQDLEDDDDDDVNNVVDNETTSSDEFDEGKDEEDGLLFFNGRSKKGRTETDTGKTNEPTTAVGVHLFSLSLPRDAHMDAHMQKKNSMNGNNNEKITGFSSLQKLKLTISGGSKCTCKTINKFSTSNLESPTETEVCEVHGCQTMFRSDNWVLHKTGTKDGATNVLTGGNGKLLKDDPTPTVEPISLSYLTGGKHIMYLPGITAGKETEADDNGAALRRETTPTREPTKSAPRQRQRKKETRESLQDETPVLRHQQSQQPTNATQRFSFQSTVRMLEKRRLAEKLSRDAEVREAQRKSELEAMKRVEEDFQRKRASEKANIRHQLRLYCSGNGIDANPNSNANEQYNSLPAIGANRQQHDSNNNKISCRRADPDGAAASPSPPFIADAETRRFRHEISHLPLKRLDSDCGDSDGEGQNLDITHFNRTASMVEPYLQSFMK